MSSPRKCGGGDQRAKRGNYISYPQFIFSSLLLKDELSPDCMFGVFLYNISIFNDM